MNNDSDIFRLHVKGSPEKIFDLSLSSSIPQNYNEVKTFYSNHSHT